MDGRHPADAELELPPGLYSHEVTRLLAQQSAQVSFERAIDFVAQTTGVSVPKRQAEQLVRGAAQDFEGFYAIRSQAVVYESMALSIPSGRLSHRLVHHGLGSYLPRALSEMGRAH